MILRIGGENYLKFACLFFYKENYTITYRVATIFLIELHFLILKYVQINQIK